jgi:hypothetical protein
MAKELELDAVWDREQFENPMDAARGRVPFPSQMGAYNSQAHHYATGGPGPVSMLQHHPSAKDLLNDSKWVAELDESIGISNTPAPLEKTELMATAEEFLKSVSDPTIKATEFMSYVEKLSTGEIDTDGKSSEHRSSEWATEYSNLHNSEDVIWSDDFVTGTGDNIAAAAGTAREDVWQKLNDEWERVAQETPVHPWLSKSDSKITGVRINLCKF